MSDLNPYKENMTLRDWFAGQALATQYTQCETDPSKTADWAYQLDVLAAHGQAADAYKAQLKAEAERDVAVEALEKIADFSEVDVVKYIPGVDAIAMDALDMIKEGKL